MMKLIRSIIFLVLLIGLATAGLDYYLLINNQKPVFNIREYNELKHIEVFKGLFYQVRRKIHISDKEEINDSKNVTYMFILYKINIPTKKKKIKDDNNIHIVKSKDCTDNQSIYVEKEDYKVYTNCIEKIRIKNNKDLNEIENNQSLVNSIINKSLYLKTENDIEFYSIKTDNNETYKLSKCTNKNVYLISNSDQELDCISE